MISMIEKIFGSRIRAKILGWFFTHPEESFFVRQIATILQEDPTNLSREMSKLENLGILTSKKIGNTKHFQANPHCAFFRELKGLVLKTAGVAGQIKVALERLTGVQFAFIYGSYAKGEEKAHSDVDLMIIGDVDVNQLDPLASSLEKRLGREVNYLLFSQVEFQAKKRAKDGFLMDVLGEVKIMVIGNENELASA
jgi:predicted nucleotidyltransferase